MLLALTTLDAVDHNVLQPTPVDARRIGPLEGQLAHCCPVAPGVATQRRSPPAGNPLQHWDSCSAPERMRTSDLRFRRATLKWPAQSTQGDAVAALLLPVRPECWRPLGDET